MTSCSGMGVMVVRQTVARRLREGGIKSVLSSGHRKVAVDGRREKSRWALSGSISGGDQAGDQGPRAVALAPAGTTGSGDHTDGAEAAPWGVREGAGQHWPALMIASSGARDRGRDRSPVSRRLPLPRRLLPEEGEQTHRIVGPGWSRWRVRPAPQCGQWGRKVGRISDFRPAFPSPVPTDAAAPDKARRWGRHRGNPAPVLALLLRFYSSRRMSSE